MRKKTRAEKKPPEMQTGSAFPEEAGFKNKKIERRARGEGAMPELPEVETLCRQLKTRVVGHRIEAMTIYDCKLGGIHDVGRCRVRNVCRRGKTIMVALDDGRSIAIHLRMTGRLCWHDQNGKQTHTRWRMTMDHGHVDLVDPRRFATVSVETTRRNRDRNDLITGFDDEAFLARQATRRVSVKTLLMDPKAIAGIGNIYACEILHRAGVSPLRQAAAVSARAWKKIFRSAMIILKKAIEKRGTSVSDWRDLYGCPGENQHELKVYGREGKACCMCGGVVKRIKQGGRSTFYCEQCQK
ncbi:MAG: bifunctional DNA-formamidopyrimidine glycosylase/DNA-(apurinic or apyrimidinic site) lyase [Deltaproteobacteria bacterium]